MENTENKPQDFATEFWSRFDELAEKFAEYTADYGPQVVDLGLNVVRIDGLSSLVPAVLWLVIATCAYLCVARALRNTFSSNSKCAQDALDNWRRDYQTWKDSTSEENQRFPLTYGKPSKPEYDDSAYHLGLFFASIVFIASLLPSFFAISNVWNWVAVFAPELEVARRIIEGVI